MAAVSASQPSSESHHSETQRIGTLQMPRWAWSSVWIHDEGSVRMKLGGELVQVQAKGQWEPPIPWDKPREPLPTPRREESHQAYFLRLLALYKGKANPQEHSAWIASRQWVGESSEALRDAIAAGQDLPTHQWGFVNEEMQ